MTAQRRVVTRFAPSPTGFLHIGGARTALFNWLYARHHGGTYLLRIEDTDRARSTTEAVQAIHDGLGWLGLEGDGQTVYQFARRERHAQVAHELLERGGAYLCYCTPEELTEMREAARREGRSIRYDGRWRDRDPKDAPAGVKPVIRLKAPQQGETVIDDLVQGRVTVKNEELDDFVLLRADGTPTYMHAVVVDDHDMGITHVIRGDDHLNNAFRQVQLFRGMGWDEPAFAYIPLIHGPDGAKLSKRHGALGVDAYRDMGYLPEAMRNYLLRLGWSHGDDEIIATEQATAWFDLPAVGRSPARFDMDKLDNLNGHYIRAADTARLAGLVLERLAGRDGVTLGETARTRIERGLPALRMRAKTLAELADSAAFYARQAPLPVNDKAAKLLTPEAIGRLARLGGALPTDGWSEAAIEAAVSGFAEAEAAKLGDIAQPLRAALTGSNASPSLFEVMEILGPDETKARIEAVCGSAQQAID
jgi:glutamyl-tRNA synthetase